MIKTKSQKHICNKQPKKEIEIEKINNKWIETIYIKTLETYYNKIKTVVYSPVNSIKINKCPFCNKDLR